MNIHELIRYKWYTLIIILLVSILTVIVCVYFGIYLRRRMLQALARRAFFDKYSIDKRDKRYLVNWNKENKHNHFFLGFPEWAVANKDGTGDKRIRNNRIIWNNSVLYIDEYVVETRRPDDMLDLVYDLRYKNAYIPMCLEEERKYNWLLAEKHFFNASQDIDGIIRYYETIPTEFEKLCAMLFGQLGFYAEVTQATNDGGYDIRIEKDGLVNLVECKCYAQSHKIGRPAIQKLVGANAVELANGLVFITTSDFTPRAKEYAKECGVQLVNGEGLLELLKDSGIFSQQEVIVFPEEWYLLGEDIKQYMAQDIYYDYFGKKAFEEDDYTV